MVPHSHQDPAQDPWPGDTLRLCDVPALVAAVQSTHPELSLHLSPGAIGMDEPVLDALAAAALRRADLP